MSEKNGFFPAVTRDDNVSCELPTAGELEKVVSIPLDDLVNKAYRMKQFKSDDQSNAEAYDQLERASVIVTDIIQAIENDNENNNASRGRP